MEIRKHKIEAKNIFLIKNWVILLLGFGFAGGLGGCATHSSNLVSNARSTPDSGVDRSAQDVAVADMVCPELGSGELTQGELDELQTTLRQANQQISSMGLPMGFFKKQADENSKGKKGRFKHLKQFDHQSILPTGFIWPVADPQITSGFGIRNRRFHEGVDLRAKVGTPIYASMDGLVVYAGSKISGYGNLVILRHENEISTLYAHNKTILVKKGDFVKKGVQIAISGKSGRATGPHLHFEVRKGVHAINPERVATYQPAFFRSFDPGTTRQLATRNVESPSSSAKGTPSVAVPPQTSSPAFRRRKSRKDLLKPQKKLVSQKATKKLPKKGA
jgi:murein DD-endopeptidase MepM/ murein hydrolase activator NlpD